MRLDRLTFDRLQTGGTTARVMDNLRNKGASRWAIKIKGQVIVVGDKLHAVALYEKAVALGAEPALIRSGKLVRVMQ
jgi:hypothetical protein